MFRALFDSRGRSGNPKTKKSVCIATFLRLGAVAWLLHRKSRRKSAVHQSRSGSLSPCQSGKGSLIEKKSQKCPIFCFCNGRIAETRQIRNKNLASTGLGPENRTEVKRRVRRAAVLSICGDARLRQCRTSGGCRLSRASAKQHQDSTHGAK